MDRSCERVVSRGGQDVRLPGLHPLLHGDPERTLQAWPVAKRVARTLARIEEVLRNRRHHDIWKVGMWLGRVCQGWFNYFAVPGRWLRTFRQRLQRLWLRAIRRRSQRHRFDWKRMERMTELLWPPIRHPWPDQRFTVKHPRPDRLTSKSGSVRGGGGGGGAQQCTSLPQLRGDRGNPVLPTQVTEKLSACEMMA